MIYVIHNVMDSCENITGLNYRVLTMEDSVRYGPRRVRDEKDGPDPRIKNLAVITAKYDIRFYHESAVLECFDLIRKHAYENRMGKITIELHYNYE